jgi:hypothetical protein
MPASITAAKIISMKHDLLIRLKKNLSGFFLVIILKSPLYQWFLKMIARQWCVFMLEAG